MFGQIFKKNSTLTFMLKLKRYFVWLQCFPRWAAPLGFSQKACWPRRLCVRHPRWPLFLPTFGLSFFPFFLLLTHFGETTVAEDFVVVVEKLGPGTKSKVQVQRRSLGPKHFTKLGLPTTHTPPPPTHTNF